MAKFAQLGITFQGLPPVGDFISFDLRTNSEPVRSFSFQCVHSRTESGQYTRGTTFLEAANNFISAFSQDVGITDPRWLFSTYALLNQAGDEATVLIQWGEYDGAELPYTGDETNLYITSTAEVPPASELSFTYSAAQTQDVCDFIRLNIIQELGDFPRTIDYSIYGSAQQKIAAGQSEMWVEIPRYYEPAQTIFVTETGGETQSKQVQHVKKLLEPNTSITQNFDIGNVVTVNPQDNGVGLDLTIIYSFDGTFYSSSNVFENVPSGEQTFYTRDQFGCVTSTTIMVPEFKISEIYSVHNPLNFIIEKTDEPENVPCVIEVNGNSIGTFKAIPFDTYGGANRYILFADEPIRANMPNFDDYPQPQDALSEVINISARVKITEESNGNIISEFVAVNAARQLGGDGAKMVNLVDNAEPDFVFVEGQPGYVYFYDNDFFREKILLVSDTQITRLGITKNIEVLPSCEDDIILKYLDRNGMYRFYKFDRAYEISVEPEQIGRTQTIFESIATAQGITKNIGYKNEKQLSVTAIKVPDKHMESLQDIFVSPRVYMHVGDLGLDGRENWVLVDVEGDGVIKHPKRKFNDIRLTLTLPQEYNLTML